MDVERVEAGHVPRPLGSMRVSGLWTIEDRGDAWAAGLGMASGNGIMLRMGVHGPVYGIYRLGEGV